MRVSSSNYNYITKRENCQRNPHIVVRRRKLEASKQAAAETKPLKPKSQFVCISKYIQSVCRATAASVRRKEEEEEQRKSWSLWQCKIPNRRSTTKAEVRVRTHLISSSTKKSTQTNDMKMEVLLVNQFQREFGSPKLGVQGEFLIIISSADDMKIIVNWLWIDERGDENFHPFPSMASSSVVWWLPVSVSL